METALDLLMNTKEDVNLLSEESDICTIDAKTRVIFVPSTIVVGGVQSDKNAERIKFSCPKIVGDNLDLSKFSVRINFENVSSVDFNVSIKDQYICDDVAVDGENVTFSWLIGRNAARYMGTVRFIVCAVKTDSDSNISVEWNTAIAEVPVLEGIEIDQPQIGQEEKDVINQLLELTKNTSAEAIQNVNSAKQQAIKDIQSVSQPDTTLTIEGGLAEAKATGEAIDSLKEDIGNKTNLNTNDKTNIVNAINEVNNRFLEPVEYAVNNWLDEHPEATTTVQDGAIIEPKIHSSFLPYIKNNYVTPEMFGAVGDGVHDDTQAIQICIDSAVRGQIVTFGTKKIYKITKNITVPVDISLYGNYCTIKCEHSDEYTLNYAFIYNIDASGNVINQYPLYRTIIKEFYIEGDANNFGLNGFYICQQVSFQNIVFKYIDKCIVFHQDYIDHGVVEDCYFSGRLGENYAIYSGKKGDMRVFKRLQCGGGENNKLLKIGKEHLCVNVENIVQGSIYTESTTRMSNIMLSFSAMIEIHGADCILEHIYCTKNNLDDYRIKVFANTYGTVIKRPFVEITNFMGAYIETGITNYKSSIYLDDCRAFKFTNVLTSVRIGRAGNAFASAYENICGNSKLRLNAYNNCPFYFNGKYYDTLEAHTYGMYKTPSQCGISSVGLSSSNIFTGATGTYYYSIKQIFNDTVPFGWNKSVVKSVNAVNGNGSAGLVPVLTLNENHRFPAKYRIYRGTSETFTHYADISIVNNKIIDTGDIVNGIPWKEYTEDALSYFTNLEYIRAEERFNSEYDCKLIAYSTISNWGASQSHIAGWENGDRMILITSPYSEFVFDGEKWVKTTAI